MFDSLRSLFNRKRTNSNRSAPRKIDTNPLYYEPKAVKTMYADASRLRSKDKSSEKKLRSYA